jgi:hypothetical protein
MKLRIYYNLPHRWMRFIETEDIDPILALYKGLDEAYTQKETKDSQTSTVMLFDLEET